MEFLKNFLISVEIEELLLFGAVIFLVSLLATKAGTRFGVPTLLIFLFVGMAFGTDGLGFHFDNHEMTQAIGTVALCIILFSGGLDTQYDDIRPVAVKGTVLATLGVFLTALFAGLFIYFVVLFWFPSISISFLESMLLASVMASTDSASVFAILRGKHVRLRNNLKPTLELESGSNDPMAYMMTIVLIDLIIADKDGAIQTSQYISVVITFFKQFVIGAGAGFLLGKLSVWFINKVNFDNNSLYPVLLFTCGVFIFSSTDIVGGNGFLAVYLAGLVIGNSKFVRKRESIRVFDGFAWISQIVMFLTLGLLVKPTHLLPVAGVSLLIGAFMIFGARPLSVFISFLPFRKTTFRDKTFISWVGLKGAVPILFAIFPYLKGLECSNTIFNVVFFITLLSLLLQGTSLIWVADKLHLSYTEDEEIELKEFHVEFAEDISATITELEVNSDLLRKGGMLSDFSLPEHCLPIMLKRDDAYMVPNGDTALMKHDKLLVITTNEELLLKAYHELGVHDFRFVRNGHVERKEPVINEHII